MHVKQEVWPDCDDVETRLQDWQTQYREQRAANMNPGRLQAVVSSNFITIVGRPIGTTKWYAFMTQVEAGEFMETDGTKVSNSRKKKSPLLHRPSGLQWEFSTSNETVSPDQRRTGRGPKKRRRTLSRKALDACPHLARTNLTTNGQPVSALGIGTRVEVQYKHKGGGTAWYAAEVLNVSRNGSKIRCWQLKFETDGCESDVKLPASEQDKTWRLAPKTAGTSTSHIDSSGSLCSIVQRHPIAARLAKEPVRSPSGALSFNYRNVESFRASRLHLQYNVLFLRKMAQVVATVEATPLHCAQ